MFSKSQILNMNYDKKYSASPWIKNLNTLEDNKLYKLYATKNASLSSGSEYIALPSNTILSASDITKYNIIN